MTYESLRGLHIPKWLPPQDEAFVDYSGFLDPVDHRAALFVYGDKARNSNFPARESEHVTLSRRFSICLSAEWQGSPQGRIAEEPSCQSTRLKSFMQMAFRSDKSQNISAASGERWNAR